MTHKLDKKDILILWELVQNSKLPITQIAKKVILPKETVNYRIEQMQKQKILKKFFAIIDSSRLGLTAVETFIKLQGISANELKQAIKKLKEYKFTARLISTAGPFTLCCTFMVKDPAQLYECCSYIRNLLHEYIAKMYMNHALNSQQFGYPFFKDKSESPLEIRKYSKNKIELDKLNKKILTILTKNCRTPKKHIAETLNVTEITVRKRIKWLEKNKIIKKYSILLHPGNAGYLFYILYIRVHLPNDKLEKKLKTIPEIFYLKKNSIGFYDYKVEFYIKNESRIFEIEEELYTKFPEIIRNIDILHVKKENTRRYFLDV